MANSETAGDAQPPISAPPIDMKSLRPLGVVDEDEREITVVYRHPFGIIVQLLIFGLGLTLAIGTVGYFLPSVISRDSSTYRLIVLIVLLVAGAAILLMFGAIILYRQSRLLVTNKNLTQIIQRGIFFRITSQLSLANVEDVTAHQKGFFATFLNFGTLTVETAGEQENFIFKYCPDVQRIAKAILEAREQYIENDPEAAKRGNDRLNLPGFKG